MENRIQKLSLGFQDGAEITCSKEQGFSTALEVILVLRNTSKELESMRLAFVRDVLKSRKEQNGKEG